MSIWGKVLGGAAGFAIGGPLGAILGTAAGHAVDKMRDSTREGGEDTTTRRLAFGAIPKCPGRGRASRIDSA